VAHPNAPLTELGRLRLARAIVDQGWPAARAAERFQVSRSTAHRWATRYRDQGVAGMTDRSSRPTTHPTAPRHRWSARSCSCAGGNDSDQPRSLPRSAGRLHGACDLGPLSDQPPPRPGPGHRPADPPLRARPSRIVGRHRCQEAGQHPGRGGHRFLGRAAGKSNSQADHSSGRTSRHRNPLHGHGFIHAAVDDHSRLAYAEIHPDERRETAAEFLTRAHAWFADRGVVIARVLTDNGGCYRSHLWREVCQQLEIIHKRTRPYRPQTNGKVERFHRTLIQGWAYRRLYPSEQARRAAFAPWLHWYNHHRPTPHSAVVHPSAAAPTSPSLTASRPGAPAPGGGPRCRRPGP
jgi:Integrase core domain/leucine-zipper of insertion element IS481